MMKPRTISVDAAPRSSQLLARSNVAEMSSLGLYPNVKAKTLNQFIREHVDVQGTTVMTDQMQAYWGLLHLFSSKSANHQVEYVSGNIHTNNVESYWALLKRGVMGQYPSNQQAIPAAISRRIQLPIQPSESH